MHSARDRVGPPLRQLLSLSLTLTRIMHYVTHVPDLGTGETGPSVFFFWDVHRISGPLSE